MQGAVGSQELCLLDSGLPGITFLGFSVARIVMLLRCDRRATRSTDEVDVVIRLAVLIDVRQAAEVASDAYRPVQGSRLQLNLVEDFIDQLQRLAAHAVPLVDNRNDRQSAGLAHAEELEGLGLEALGGVDKHDRGIHGRENAVGILREVRVTWGVNEVDHEGLALMVLRRVLKLQRGGSYRNTAFLFHLHPVGDSGLAVALAVHRTGFINNVRV